MALCSGWGGSASAEIGKNFVIQKTRLRIINGMNFRQSCRSVFRQNKVLSIVGLYEFECLMFVINNQENCVSDLPVLEYSTRNHNLMFAYWLTVTEKRPTICV